MEAAMEEEKKETMSSSMVVTTDDDDDDETSESSCEEDTSDEEEQEEIAQHEARITVLRERRAELEMELAAEEAKKEVLIQIGRVFEQLRVAHENGYIVPARQLHEE